MRHLITARKVIVGDEQMTIAEREIGGVRYQFARFADGRGVSASRWDAETRRFVQVHHIEPEIGPRVGECDSRQQHFWMRRIGGTWYSFLHVKDSRTHPRVVVSREGADGTWSDVHQISWGA